MLFLKSESEVLLAICSQILKPLCRADEIILENKVLSQDQNKYCWAEAQATLDLYCLTKTVWFSLLEELRGYMLWGWFFDSTDVVV